MSKHSWRNENEPKISVSMPPVIVGNLGNLSTGTGCTFVEVQFVS